MAKIKLNNYIDLGSVRSVENKLLLHSQDHHMLLITNVKQVTETETYGRKNNKTREVKYIECVMYGWNRKGEFVGTYEDYTAQRFLEYDLYQLRKNYLEFQLQWKAMHEKLTALNNPLQTLANITLSPDVKKEIDRCISEDKPLLAMKLYKVETQCTLEEAKEYIKSLTF